MKGLLGKLIFKDKVKRIALGIVDSVPGLATIKQNIEHQSSDELVNAGEGTIIGQVDWLRLITSIIVITGSLLFMFGKLSFEDLEKLLNLIK